MVNVALLHFASDLSPGEVAFWATIAFLVYMLPTTVAILRESTSFWRVAAVNLLAGWTVVGWFYALADSVND